MFLDLPYGVPFKFRAPMVKAGVRDFAVSADWTPATGDVKISKDGGAIANIGTLPAVVASSAAWEFTLSAAEMQAREIFVQVIDSATKAVDDQSFILRTRPTLSSGQLSSQTGAAAGEVYIPDAAITANDQYIGARFYEWNSSGVLVGYGVITDSVEDTQDKLVLNGGAALWWTPASGNYFTIEPFGVSGVTEAQLAAAVLNATAASYNTAGTIGNKINSAGSASDPWGSTTFASAGAGSAGERLSRIPNAAAGGNGGLPTADANNAVKVQSGTGANQISLANGLVTVGTNNDKTGYALSSAGIQAIWDALTSALTTVGSIGKRIADFLTGDAFVRLGAPAGASVSADVAAVKAQTAAIETDTQDLQARTPAALVSGRMDVSVGAMAANVMTAAALAADARAALNSARKNVAFPIYLLYMRDSTTKAGATGKTVTVSISKDGGAFATATNAVSEIGNGWYVIASGFTQAEMNANMIAVKGTAPGCDDWADRIVTQPT